MIVTAKAGISYLTISRSLVPLFPLSINSKYLSRAWLKQISQQVLEISHENQDLQSRPSSARSVLHWADAMLGATFSPQLCDPCTYSLPPFLLFFICFSCDTPFIMSAKKRAAPKASAANRVKRQKASEEVEKSNGCANVKVPTIDLSVYSTCGAMASRL